MSGQFGIQEKVCQNQRFRLEMALELRKCLVHNITAARGQLVFVPQLHAGSNMLEFLVFGKGPIQAIEI
jgi:hypothetical protein